MDQFEKIIEMDAAHILNVFGEYDKYVKKLEKYLSVTIVDRDGGVRITGMRLDLFGARLELPGLLSYRQELLVALGGPAANLLTATVLFRAWTACGCPVCGASPSLSGWALVLGVLLPASLGLCAVNLLPVASLDGGRILSCLLSLTLGADVARRVLRLLSLFLLTLLWLLSVYALLRAGQFLSLFVFSFSLLVRCMVH